MAPPATIPQHYTRATEAAGRASARGRGNRPRRDELAILVLLVGGTVLGLSSMAWLAPPAALIQKHPVAISLLTAVGGIGLCAWCWRFVLWRRHASDPSSGHAHHPMVSVIVPVFNEGHGVVDVLTSLGRSVYPGGRWELIVVDDGSTDDSRHWIRAGLAQIAQSHQLICFSQNRGKRAALAAAMQRARGDIYVTIDSDCVIDPHALATLVRPLLRDPNVAAVAGQVQVRGAEKEPLPRMLAASFAIAFDWMRSAQSVLGRVLCVPGAAAAYRATAVMAVLPRWQHQRFMDRPCGIAEDRALTTHLLAAGWRTVYQPSARVWTTPPPTHPRVWRMYVRWTRGDLRETIRYVATVLGRRDRTGRRRWGADLHFLLTVMEMPLPHIALLAMLAVALQSPALVGVLAAGVLVGTLPCMLWYGLCHRTWNMAYGMLYPLYWLAACSWILPWSILTIRSDRWLTRSVGTSGKRRIYRTFTGGRAVDAA